MKTGKETTPAGNIHRQQLFNWMGRSIDWFTERLLTPWKHYPALQGRVVPPVTVLAHSDIGT